MPKYESYKDSEIDWVGDIPQHWKLKPFRSLFHFRNEKNDPLKTGNILSLSIANGVTEYTEEGRGGNKRKNDLTAYKLAYPGDIVLNSMNVIVGAVGLSKYFGAISPVYYALYIKSEHNNINYFERLFLDKSFQKGLLRHGKGIMMKQSNSGKLNTIRMKISTDDLKKTYFPAPPKEEQDCIVTFLDKKTAQIDQVIGIKEQQIALLKERKQIIIQNAVTKGLNPNAPMKDSGIDWIGTIPHHWKVEKLYGLCRFVRGNSAFAKDELLSSGQYVALQYGKTYKVDEVDNSYEFYVNEEFYKKSQVINFGDVIFISTSETIEDLGHSAIYNRDEVGLVGGEQLLIKPNNDLLDHYYIYYSTKVFSKELRKYATGIKVFRFNINDLKTIYTAVPTKEEQRKIVRHISTQSKKIDQAMSLQKSQINNLKEYKTSLINSAVTGKIKTTQGVSEKTYHSKAFEDAVFIAVLVKQFSNEKFQINRFRYTKYSYLLHRKLSHSVENYKKKAAGPYDSTTRYGGGEKIALNKKYIKQTNNTYKGFVGGENNDEANNYFYKWFGSKSLNWLEQFRYTKNDKLGLITTIDMAMLEIKENNQAVNLQSIKQVLQEDEEWKNKLNDKTYSDENITSTIKELKRLFCG